MKFKELQPFAQIAWIIVGMFVFVLVCGIFSDWVGSPSQPRVTAYTPPQPTETPSERVTDPNDPWAAMQRNFDIEQKKDANYEKWARESDDPGAVRIRQQRVNDLVAKEVDELNKKILGRLDRGK